jgi:hypothetical protein
MPNLEKSRFGFVLPTVDKVVQAIATRDNAQFLPSGMTALNILGLSTQVPMNYTYLTLLRPGITFNASDAYPLIYETFIDKMEGKRLKIHAFNKNICNEGYLI